MISIRLYREADIDSYEACIASAPDNLVYPTRQFLAFLEEVTGAYVQCLVAEQNNEIVGVLPWFEKRVEPYGTVCNSLPWYGSYGGSTLAKDADSTVRERLLSAYVEHLHAIPDLLTATTILSPFENQFLATYQSHLYQQVQDSRIGQITRLPDAGSCLEERLMTVISQKTRNLVRKSLKQGFALEVRDDDASWQFLCEVHHENMAAVGGKPKPEEHFTALRRHIPGEWRELLLASLDGEPVAALLLLTFNRTVEYITPVIRHEYRSQQPLSFLIWHGMLRGINRGAYWWNWGGTWHTQHSLHHFKAGWGAVDMPYTYLVQGRDEAPALIKSDPDGVSAAFPWFYQYPFHLLASS